MKLLYILIAVVPAFMELVAAQDPVYLARRCLVKNAAGGNLRGPSDQYTHRACTTYNQGSEITTDSGLCCVLNANTPTEFNKKCFGRPTEAC
ncbi:hypothetical protein PVAG01_07059 [Phlyctema vagabunda]|uniref:Uncharacterized protein n=1 Tax=Phlyctema vagabunda TaxID=108571 RepID=A0ABR4PBF6_9HELO